VICVTVAFQRYLTKFRLFLLKEYVRQCADIMGTVCFSILDTKV